jgi:hypothetical protein
LSVPELAHWYCWGLGTKKVNLRVPNCTPEAAMELLLEKARLVHGEQPWSAWTWVAREFAPGTRDQRRALHLLSSGAWTPRTIRFTWRDGAWTRLTAI